MTVEALFLAGNVVVVGYGIGVIFCLALDLADLRKLMRWNDEVGQRIEGARVMSYEEAMAEYEAIETEQEQIDKALDEITMSRAFSLRILA